MIVSLSPPSSPAPNDTARTSPSVTALPGSTCWVAVHCSAGGVCGRCTGPASSLPSTSSSCNPVSTPGMPSLAYTNCSSLSLCREYGNQNKKRRHFQESVGKLDDNIMYLCFSQVYFPSSYWAGHPALPFSLPRTSLSLQSPQDIHWRTYWL